MLPLAIAAANVELINALKLPYRVGVAQVSYPMGEAPIPVDVPPHSHEVRDVMPAADYSLRRADSKQATDVTLGPPPAGTSFVPDWPTHERAISYWSEFTSEMKTRSANEWMAASEYDNARKICIQKGGYPGWHVLPDGLFGPERPELKAVFHTLASAWLRVVAKIGKDHRHPAGAAKLNTAHGMPTYRSNEKDMLDHVHLAALGGYSWGGVLGILRKLSADLTGHVRACELLETPHAITLSRTGPLAKPVTVFMRKGGVMHSYGKVQGMRCRRRIVYSCPFWTNVLIRPIYSRLAGLVRAAPCAGGIKTKDELAIHTFKWRSHVWNDDISNFDLSVPFWAQVALRDALSQLWPEVRESIEAMFQTSQMAVLAPGWSAGCAGIMHQSRGGTKSGSLTTSLEGFIQNTWRIAYSLHRAQGWSLDRAMEWVWLSGDCLVWGDDTLFTLPGLNIEAYQAASLEIGYECKIGPGRVFLRTLFPAEEDGYSEPTWTEHFSRFGNQRFYNEHSPPEDIVEILGMWSSSLHLDRNPYFDWDGITPYAAHILDRYRMRTYADLQRLPLREDIAKEVMEYGHRNPRAFGSDYAASSLSNPSYERARYLSAVIGHSFNDLASPKLDVDQAMADAENSASYPDLRHAVIAAHVHKSDVDFVVEHVTA